MKKFPINLFILFVCSLLVLVIGVKVDLRIPSIISLLIPVYVYGICLFLFRYHHYFRKWYSPTKKKRVYEQELAQKSSKFSYYTAGLSVLNYSVVFFFSGYGSLTLAGIVLISISTVIVGVFSINFYLNYLINT